MTEPMRDDQLIFMISLPRSGSTLLQKILGGHSDIYTRSEPWLMLHPLYALKSTGIQANYNASLATNGVRDFIAGLPENGDSLYYSQLRNCYLSLYAPYLHSSEKSRFLDKTPRYYAIFDELQKTFPNAKFIILYRNPLAVLASMLEETWVKTNIGNLKSYRMDLYEGAKFLQRDFSAYVNTFTVRYEELLLNPEHTTETLFNFLGLPNQPDCIEYGNHGGERWMYGDPITVYEKSRPDAKHAAAWQKQLAIPENRKLLLDYLQLLGRDGLECLGYSFDEARNSFFDTGESPHAGAPEANLLLANLLLTDTEQAQHIRQHNTKLQQDIQTAEARLKKAEQQLDDAETTHDRDSKLIQNLSEQIDILKDQLTSRDGDIRARDEQIGLLDAQLKECEKQLKATQNSLTQEQHRSKELQEIITMTLNAMKRLTAHRAYAHPLRKLQAYKELLKTLNTIRIKTHVLSNHEK